MMKDLKKEETPRTIGRVQNTREEESLLKYIQAYEAGSQMEMIRLTMVKRALESGVAAAAEEYECHRNTVSKWVNRYRREGESGLKDLACIPHRIPHRIDEPGIMAQVLQLREETGYGAERLKVQYGLWPSAGAIHRILRDHGKIEPVKKKHQKRQDLWNVKKQLRALGSKLQLDGKQLTDIAHYYPFYAALGLPKWQFTLRCVKSGATFVSFMEGEKGMEASVFMVYVFEHLKRHGVDVSGLTIQVDGIAYAHNFKSLKKTAFRELIESYGATLRIKPGGGTNQSDVESFHNLIEVEFYDRQDFVSKSDFYGKVYRYMLGFNYVRKNRHKDWQAPLYFLSQDQPKVSPEVLDLPPIYLEAHHELYLAKLDPHYLRAQEESLLDIPPEELPVKDFSPNEFIDVFIHRVQKADPVKFSIPAHDVPVYPIVKN